MQYFSKFLGSTSSGLGYVQGERIETHDDAGLWELHAGTHKESGQRALVFSFHPERSRCADGARLARNAVQKLKTLRHPDILKYINSEEASDGSVTVVTEPAVPLAALLRSSKKLEPASVAWGLLCVSRALCFLHSTQTIHGRLSDVAIFVTPGGDWRLGAFEIATPVQSAGGVLSNSQHLQTNAFLAPEAVRGQWNMVSPGLDSWALGCLAFACHANGLSSPEQLRNIEVLPTALRPQYQRLLASAPPEREQAEKDFASCPYVANHKYVELNLFVENLALKDTFEKEAFFNRLPAQIERVPRDCAVHKLLPLLSANIKEGVCGPASLSCVKKLREGLNPLPDAEFKEHVADPFALGWYASMNASMDRATRLELVSMLGIFAPFFDANAINNTLFAAYVTGFQDATSPALRDLSVKTTLIFADKLNDRNLNTQLMAHFAKLQVDPEAAIRTNTTICLSKLASQMSEAARNKVLVSAFLRALKDPFPAARTAGLTAYITCRPYLVAQDVASRVLPAVCPLLLDANADVRDKAMECMTELMPVIKERTKQLDLQNAKQGNGAVATRTNAADAGSSSWALQGFSALTSALSGAQASTGNEAMSAEPSGIKTEPSSVAVASAGTSGMALQSASASAVAKNAVDDILGYDNNDHEVEENGWGDFDGADSAFAESTDQNGSSLNISQGNTSVGQPKSEWDFGDTFSQQQPVARPISPPRVQAPTVPSTAPISSTTTTAGARRTGARGSRAGAGSNDDDWGALLGGSSSTTSTRPRARAAPKLGAVRR